MTKSKLEKLYIQLLLLEWEEKDWTADEIKMLNLVRLRVYEDVCKKYHPNEIVKEIDEYLAMKYLAKRTK